MYPLQIHAASKNIHLITVAGCHRSLFWKYKLVLSSSEIRDWKLGTSVIRTKEKLSKIWDLCSDGMGKGKRKRKKKHLQQPLGTGEISRRSAPQVRGEGKGEKTSRDNSARLNLRRFPALPLHGVSGLPPRTPLNSSLISHGDHRGWNCPQDHTGAAEFRQESTASRAPGTPRQWGGCRKELPFPGNGISSPLNFAWHNSSVVRHSLSLSMVYLKGNLIMSVQSNSFKLQKTKCFLLLLCVYCPQPWQVASFFSKIVFSYKVWWKWSGELYCI